MIKVYFKKLTELAVMPTFNYEAAAFDFYSTARDELWVGKTIVVPTGLAWEPDLNDFPYSQWFKPYLKIEGRSGLAAKNGIDVLAGVIDQDYRGEIKVVLSCNKHIIEGSRVNVPFEINPGDKIAQGIVYLIPNIEISEKDELSNTQRGEKGFGSSDKSYIK